jgi:sigma-54 dependent transcriptional regulator, acetoin dehydrogenase operon transcriptional activator AcoR
LSVMVQQGLFRKDLFYRIRGATIRLPAVRERSDVLELANALLHRLAKKMGRNSCPSLSPSVVAWLSHQQWSGNVRELRMALEHALVLASEHQVIEIIHLPESDPIPVSPATPGTHGLRDQVEREAIARVLEETSGNRSQSARLLGVSRSTLYRLMERYSLD